MNFLNQSVRLSNYVMPTLRESPSEAQIISHKLMLRAGMIKQTASGIYSWLPLGYRVLKKIEQIVREEQDKAGAHEVLMATIQPAELWQESGRYDDYGAEMLRINDRHGRALLYGPTNEEVITAVFRDSVNSYRDLPRLVYHIQWKFRDEIRPRFGIMRGREFYMKDGYSFDISPEAGKHSYNKMFVSYLRTFARLGLQAIPMRADTGPIGGDSSHEFIILADTGESTVYLDKRMLNIDSFNQDNIDYGQDLSNIINEWTNYYAVTDEEHDDNPDIFTQQVPEEHRLVTKGIEVGHIFFFGDKYSKPMNAHVTDKDGKKVFLQSGSYGIGVSRLVGGIIEACHDDNGIIWPYSVAPFQAGLINLHAKDEGAVKFADDLYEKLNNASLEILYDDRDDLRAGAKFGDADLIGLPYQVIVGKNAASDNMLEVKSRKSGEKMHLSVDEFLNYMTRSHPK